MDKLTFTTKTKAVSVEIDGKPHELREMTAGARDRYLDQLGGRVVTGGDGKPTIRKFDGLQSDLLQACLYDSSSNTAWSSAAIQKLPASTCQALFEAAQALNELDKKDEPAKNV